ncbi:hypothetical protein KUM39_04710 [Streptomyces sp. J2-1]|uniref:hypothetical protein n=1 Tax=Streptomyces corallincola TaxID=2851888 RepID=UPI001C3814CB|nr:hypothetical protein [Streptomyces corallincola]MBV2353668.1 hypothetical protein [Streptomyces corallincola]
MSSLRGPFALAGCVLVSAVLVAGCGTGGSSSARHTAAGPAARPASHTSAAVTTPAVTPADVRTAPSLDGVAAAKGAGLTQGHRYSIARGYRPGRTLVVEVNCLGPGTLTVRTGHDTSFRAPCRPGESSPLRNEYPVHGSPATAAVLHFTADPDVTYSFAAGWTNGPAEG